MRLVLLASLLLAVACGRVGYNGAELVQDAAQEDAAPQDAQLPNADVVVIPPDAMPPANLVFTTQLGGPIRTIDGDLSIADSACNNAAANEGLDGTYVAFLSTTSQSAISRLDGARGWRRLDGLPFADRQQDIATGRIFYPVVFDSRGQQAVTRVVTGSTSSGELSTQPGNCNDYELTSTGGVTSGFTKATSGSFADTRGVSSLCQAGNSVYCFGIDRMQAVGLLPGASGPIAFVTPNWIPVGGLAGADAACQADAANAGISGNFLAFLATTTTTAASRFSMDGQPWVRVDGVRLADTRTKFMNGEHAAPNNITVMGTYLGGNTWAGAPDPFTVGPECCADWTRSDNATPFVQVGRTALATPGFFGTDQGFSQNNPCSATNQALICLQQ